MPVQPCRERTSGLVGAGSFRKAFSAFTTSDLAKCWPARCWARSHSRPRATRRTVSELRTHACSGTGSGGKSCLGILILGRFFTSCLQKGSEALGGVGARGCPLPLADSALQPPPPGGPLDRSSALNGCQLSKGSTQTPGHPQGRLLP